MDIILIGKKTLYLLVKIPILTILLFIIGGLFEDGRWAVLIGMLRLL